MIALFGAWWFFGLAVAAGSAVALRTLYTALLDEIAEAQARRHEEAERLRATVADIVRGAEEAARRSRTGSGAR